MNTIFKKLNFKDQKKIHVINAPNSFQSALRDMEALTEVKTTLANAKEIAFLLAFVTKQREVDSLANEADEMMIAGGVLWFAYPKKTSKKYQCEFNRDNGWSQLGKLGYEGVRMIAIDDDWSALRFKKAEDIKKMTRRFAMSEQGEKKASSKKV